VALVAVAAAVAAGSHIGGTRSLPALVRGDSESYAHNAIGHVAPVDAKFVARRVGSVGTPAPTPTTAPSSPRARPSTPQAPPQKTIHGSPGGVGGLSPGGWELSLSMAPDRATARAGDEVRYRMTVTNVGAQDFYGRAFQLEWHTPNGTFGHNAIQQCSLVTLAIVQTLCLSQRLMLSPGLGETSHQRFDSSGLIVIRSGQSWSYDWFVQVLPSNAEGSTIFNHAHLHVNLSGRQLWIRTPDVVVKVVA
jgi:hypothetical protein